MGVFRVIDKILLIFLLLVIGPFLWVGISSILAKAPGLLIGVGLGLLLVFGFWRLVKKLKLLEDNNE